MEIAGLVKARKISHEDALELDRLFSRTGSLEPKGYRLHNTPEERKQLDLLSRSVAAGLVEDQGTRVPMPSTTSGGKPLYSKTSFVIKPEAKRALAEYLKNHSG